MSTIKIAYATVAAFTITPGALANGSARRCLAVANNSNLYVDALVLASATSGASGVSATGHADVYAYASADDGTTFETGGSSDAGYTLRGDEKYLGSFAMIANSTVYTGVFNVAKAYGDRMPRDWGIIVANNSGAAWAASTHIFKFQGVTYTVA